MTSRTTARSSDCKLMVASVVLKADELLLERTFVWFESGYTQKLFTFVGWMGRGHFKLFVFVG